MKVSVPKGTRDFSPAEMVKRNFIFKTIREVFEKYGFQPIETPAMEQLETLTGKYGEEGDKLIFKILNSGNYLEAAKVRKHVLKDIGENNFSKLDLVVGDYYPLGFVATPKELLNDISEKALRYDLTVPFARYVVQHQNEISFPFKRYQIQPVWRADKPQKGRYREFFQCDADVIGSDSLLNEVEIVQMIDEVMTKLKINVTIKINNRKLLQGIADYFKITNFTEFVTILDKADKMGVKFIKEELSAKNILHHPETEIFGTLFFEAEQKELKQAVEKNKLNLIRVWSEEVKSEAGMKGIEEMGTVFTLLRSCALQTAACDLDISLARGLNYYTGAIFEVKANGVEMGSICGGGRYDDLTGNFGLPNVSGVGISFGIDRIFDVMNELNLFESLGLPASTTKVMLAHFGATERKYCIGVAAQLRSAGINTEIYPDVTKKISKQFDYANKKQIPFVIVIGADEVNTGDLTLKDMNSGQQSKVKLNEIINLLK